jgi:hypothetical protein
MLATRRSYSTGTEVKDGTHGLHDEACKHCHALQGSGSTWQKLASTRAAGGRYPVTGDTGDKGLHLQDFVHCAAHRNNAHSTLLAYGLQYQVMWLRQGLILDDVYIADRQRTKRCKFCGASVCERSQLLLLASHRAMWTRHVHTSHGTLKATAASSRTA